MKLTKIITCPTCKGKGKQTVPDVKAMRKHRTKKGVSIRGIARKIGISAPFLSDVETGFRPCPEYILKAYQKL